MFTGITSPWHLLLLFFAILMFFGAKRLPEMGRSLGQGMREFKQSISGEAADESHTEVAPAALPPAPVNDRDAV